MEARFTMTLYDARNSDPTFWDWLDWGTRTEDFKTMLISMWDLNEISGETIPEQKKFMLDTFNEYKTYYTERLENYEKSIDWTEGDTITSSEIHVELPNKKIDPDDIFAYANDGVKSSTKDPSRLLSLRRTYLAQIKDYYREFTLRFAACFIHMF